MVCLALTWILYHLRHLPRDTKWIGMTSKVAAQREEGVQIAVPELTGEGEAAAFTLAPPASSVVQGANLGMGGDAAGVGGGGGSGGTGADKEPRKLKDLVKRNVEGGGNLLGERGASDDDVGKRKWEDGGDGDDELNSLEGLGATEAVEKALEEATEADVGGGREAEIAEVAEAEEPKVILEGEGDVEIEELSIDRKYRKGDEVARNGTGAGAVGLEATKGLGAGLDRGGGGSSDTGRGAAGLAGRAGEALAGAGGAVLSLAEKAKEASSLGGWKKEEAGKEESEDEDEEDEDTALGKGQMVARSNGTDAERSFEDGKGARAVHGGREEGEEEEQDDSNNRGARKSAVLTGEDVAEGGHRQRGGGGEQASWQRGEGAGAGAGAGVKAGRGQGYEEGEDEGEEGGRTSLTRGANGGDYSSRRGGSELGGGQVTTTARDVVKRRRSNREEEASEEVQQGQHEEEEEDGGKEKVRKEEQVTENEGKVAQQQEQQQERQRSDPEEEQEEEGAGEVERTRQSRGRLAKREGAALERGEAKGRGGVEDGGDRLAGAATEESEEGLQGGSQMRAERRRLGRKDSGSLGLRVRAAETRLLRGRLSRARSRRAERGTDDDA
eukprot:jgi/Mesen1/3927/ME000209S02943